MPHDPSRRALLGAAITIPVASLAGPTITTPFDLSTSPDAPLWRLWQRVLELEAKHVAKEAALEARYATLPEWARPNPDSENRFCPEWSAAMLAEHDLPPELGRRPSMAALQKLNRRLEEAAVDALIPPRDALLEGMSFKDALEIARTARKAPSVAAVREANAVRLDAWRTRFAEMNRLHTDAGIPAIEAEMERLGTRTNRLLSRVATTPARTPFGALIKLRAWRLQTLDWNGPFADLTDPANQAALSALATLEAMFSGFSSLRA